MIGICWLWCYNIEGHDQDPVSLQKLRVVQITWRECSQRVDQLSRNVFCAWQELGTKGTCQVLSPHLRSNLHMHHHVLGSQEGD